MKIDFDVLERLAAAGAPASAIIEYLRIEDAKRAPKRARDKSHKRATRQRQRATTGDMTPTPSDNEATLSDTPRARLYREGSAAIMALGRTERAARQLIAGWLKATNDDDQLVTATILRARDLAVADAAGWITATLKGKANGTKRSRSLASAADDLIARAESFERENDFGTVIDAEPIVETREADRR